MPGYFRATQGNQNDPRHPCSPLLSATSAKHYPQGVAEAEVEVEVEVGAEAVMGGGGQTARA